MPAATTPPPTVDLADIAMSAVLAFVGVGANLGDASNTVQQAIAELALLPRTRLTASSSLYRSAPVEAQGADFINAVVALHTKLPALSLLHELQAIEQRHGRDRPFVNAPRTLDLDLLLHGDERLNLPRLQLPHPRAHLRAFVLMPLAELCPTFQWPGYGPIADLLAAVGNQPIEKISR
jgi:2-amino-4-hydroxy-6-hydroxymethyldihydropteridine diphosphokinase